VRILLANPRGFCAGVDRAIEIVERAIALFGAPIHVRHEVVHNRTVVERLRALGAVFVEELHESRRGHSHFSAHGVSTAVEQEAQRRGLQVFDATCPLVTKVHMEVARFAREGRDVLLIGHAGHPEVEGTMGRFDGSRGGRILLIESVTDVQRLQVRDPQQLAFVTQTTLSVDAASSNNKALRTRFPALQAPRKAELLRHPEPAGCGSSCSSSARCWWSSVRAAAPIQTGCASSPTGPACPAISSTARRTCAGSGSRAASPSA
jgi:4-hydroxy-3-methylbut-2-enyl diphosphate reductase